MPEASVDVKLVKGQDDDWSAGTEPRSLGSIKEGSKGNSPHSSLKGLDTDSTTGAASVYSSHRYVKIFSSLKSLGQAR